MSRKAQSRDVAAACRMQVTNTNASTSTLYMTIDNADGSYSLTAPLTLAANYAARLYIGGVLAAGAPIVSAAHFGSLLFRSCAVHSVVHERQQRLGCTAVCL